ncbi:MAG: glycosyltransferase family 2 protein [Chloroflexi bacterium]|nr:glycosyltransferase family 2 protein [Chloroflexota bacterium]
MEQLAIVIVSWNVCALLRACLASLYADLEGSTTEAEVWVVDNASDDGTPEIVAREFPRCRLIASTDNLGFVAGNNLALSRIQQGQDRVDAVWFLNPDTRVLPGATSALLHSLTLNEDVGVVGARLLNPDGSLQHGAFRFPGLFQLAFELYPLPARLYDTPLNGRYSSKLYANDAAFAVDHPLGASMMVRGAAIEDVGPWDERFHMYCEEIDWCWRMRKAGWRALCVPTARVIHYGGQSSSQVPVASFIRLWTSRALLYRRHHHSAVYALARAMVVRTMSHRARRATPEMAEACRQVISAWDTPT